MDKKLKDEQYGPNQTKPLVKTGVPKVVLLIKHPSCCSHKQDVLDTTKRKQKHK